MDVTEKIEAELSPIVESLGYGIVRVVLTKQEKRQTMQIMIERLDGKAVSITDCEEVSRNVSVCLDVLDPLTSGYSLEVSSPGINRPLVKPKDFVRFCGRHVIVKTVVAMDNRRVFKGLLENASENGIKLRLDLPLSDGCDTVDLSYDEVSSASIDGMRT